jgi:hypothetical protein
LGHVVLSSCVLVREPFYLHAFCNEALFPLVPEAEVPPSIAARVMRPTGSALAPFLRGATLVVHKPPRNR